MYGAFQENLSKKIAPAAFFCRGGGRKETRPLTSYMQVSI